MLLARLRAGLAPQAGVVRSFYGSYGFAAPKNAPLTSREQNVMFPGFVLRVKEEGMARGN